MRIGHGRTSPSRRALAALGLATALAVACGSSSPTTAPTGSPSAGATERPSGGVVVGAPGDGPSYTEAPAPAIQVDFEVNGDENNGWWWLRDEAGAQQASWGFFDVPAGNPIELDLDLLATDTTTGASGLDARFWLSYGAITEADGTATYAPGVEPVLVTLPNTAPAEDPVGYTTSGTYTIAARDIAADADGIWVRIARLGPDGSVLPENLAVAEASVRVASVGGPDATLPPSGSGQSADVDFEVNGDEISGWWWLRDARRDAPGLLGLLRQPGGRPAPSRPGHARDRHVRRRPRRGCPVLAHLSHHRRGWRRLGAERAACS